MAVLLLLGGLGCGGPGGPGGGGPGGPGGPDGGPGGPGGPGDARGTDARGAPAKRPAPGAPEVVRLVEPGSEIVVTLDITLDTKSRGTVSFLGAKASNVEGEWLKQDVRPDFFWSSAEVKLDGDVSLNAPLPEGLTYIALVNQDGDPVPSDGDLTSMPVAYAGGGTLHLTIDGQFGERRAPMVGGGPEGGAGGAQGEGVGQAPSQPRFPKRSVLIDAPQALRPLGSTVILVVGQRPAPAGADPADAPDYLWRSKEFTPSVWPHAAELPLPQGMGVQVLLDADGDKMPSPGDPATDIQAPTSDRPTDTARTFVLDRRYESGGEPAPTPAARLPAISSAGGAPRELEITSEMQLPFLKTGRFMVAGLPPGDVFAWPPAVRPDFLWVSEPTRLQWPVKFEAQLPDGLDLIVVLDLDGDGLPGAGDLSSQPMQSFKRGDGGVKASLTAVIPPSSGG
jgi:hypothetical protein